MLGRFSRVTLQVLNTDTGTSACWDAVFSSPDKNDATIFKAKSARRARTRIYHSNYSAGVVLAHDVDADGTATGRRVFARMPKGNPDGLAVDESGAVLVALAPGGGVARFHASGELDAVITVPARFVTSLCFGGEHRRDLYIVTADNTDDPARGGTIFRTRADVPGLIAPLARV